MKDKEREEQKRRLYFKIMEYCKKKKYTSEEIKVFFEIIYNMK